MTVRLSIRSYTLTMQAHSHEYHQVVLPLHGSIDIQVSNFHGLVGPGQCVLIKSDQRHSFRSDEQASFVVVDSDELPDNLQSLAKPSFYISPPLISFCVFAEKQLQHQINAEIEHKMGELFSQLLLAQDFQLQLDERIARVVNYLNLNLGQTPLLSELASLACLSLSQYKTLFKQEMGKSTGRYLLDLRMEKARALLAHSDFPVGIIAEKVGYLDASAFSRRFSNYFGQSPRSFLPLR